MRGLWKCLLLQVLACLGQKARGSEIIDGEKAPEGSLLYMASLQSKGSHVCGGFLIREDFVLTAAHCDYSKPTQVVLGTHNLKKVDNGNILGIEKRYRHPSFENEGQGNDIMLLKLSRKVQLDKNVQAIPLPSSEVSSKAKCTVAGWGGTVTRGGAVDELRVVDVSVIDHQACMDKWLPLRPPGNVICAGGYGTSKGFCQGDSGGPLVCNGMAVGVVSFNKDGNCKYPNVPNVYTDISKYLPWIHSILISASNHYE